MIDKIFGVILGIICMLLMTVFAITLTKLVIQDSKVPEYVKEHNCVITGYAGTRPNAVYNCDNGIILDRDMK